MKKKALVSFFCLGVFNCCVDYKEQESDQNPPKIEATTDSNVYVTVNGNKSEVFSESLDENGIRIYTSKTPYLFSVTSTNKIIIKHSSKKFENVKNCQGIIGFGPDADVLFFKKQNANGVNPEIPFSLNEKNEIEMSFPISDFRKNRQGEIIFLLEHTDSYESRIVLENVTVK